MSVFSSCFSNNAAVMVFQWVPASGGCNRSSRWNYSCTWSTLRAVNDSGSGFPNVRRVSVSCSVSITYPPGWTSIIYELHDSETKWSLLVIVSFIFRLQGQCHQYFLLTKHCGTIRLIMVSQLTFISLLRAFTYFFYFHDFIARFDQYQPSRRGSSLNKIMFWFD